MSLTTYRLKDGYYHQRDYLKITFERRSFAQMQKIAKPSDKIQEILESVRDMEAAHSGKLSVQLEPVSLKLCIDQAINGLEDRLRDKSKSVRGFGFDRSLDGFADYSILTNQVLTNIL
ncbi:MAG: hypothetical protein R2827_11365 [Bdellovibrionales bacterium]